MIGECEVESSCAFLKSKAERRIMLKLSGGGTATIEIGKWHGVKREERACKDCHSGKVEGVCH